MKYLKGGMLVHEQKYAAALKKLDACVDHPNFQHELFYSYYGQTLCGLGKLDEGHKYLIKACKLYEKEGWVFEDDYDKNLAQNSVSALEHVFKHTNITEGKRYLEKLPKIKQNS